MQKQIVIIDSLVFWLKLASIKLRILSVMVFSDFCLNANLDLLDWKDTAAALVPRTQFFSLWVA